MKRLLLSTKARWHFHRANSLYWSASAMFDEAKAHADKSISNMLAAKALARGPLPEPAETDQPAGCSFAGRMLLGSIVGLAITFLWVWISARAGR